MTNQEIISQIDKSTETKPKDLIIDDLQWKYLIWAVLRGKNILFVGPTRCGKTKAAKSVAKLYKDRPFFYFNFGSTQDARATLIGNTTFKKTEGTVFNPSQFVKAIDTPNAIILLDELSRGHHDAWNILMPVLDTTQKYIRLDETEDSAIIKVANGVCFIATANVGNEYTATRADFKALTRISEETKLSCKMENSKINTFITTDSVIEMGGLILDGFSIKDVAEMTIYPQYSEDGGQDCERLFVKQLAQKYIDTKSAQTKSPINDPNKPNKPKRIPF